MSALQSDSLQLTFYFQFKSYLINLSVFIEPMAYYLINVYQKSWAFEVQQGTIASNSWMKMQVFIEDFGLISLFDCYNLGWMQGILLFIHLFHKYPLESFRKLFYLFFKQKGLYLSKCYLNIIFSFNQFTFYGYDVYYMIYFFYCFAY